MAQQIPEIFLFVVMREDGGWFATSEEAELLAALTAADGGCLVKSVRVRVGMVAPAAAKAEIVTASTVHSIAAE